MSSAYAWVEEQALQVGDRVRIRPDRRPLPGVPDQAGLVVKVIAMPRDSYLVRVDGDTERGRVWFFYRAEIAVEEDELLGR
jgi:hypothetical protein